LNQAEYQKQDISTAPTMSTTSTTSFPSFPSFPSTVGTSKFDLTLNAVEEADHLNLYMEYCTKLFKERTIRRYITYFKGLVQTLHRAPNQKIENIEIITEEEKQQILYKFNDTAVDYTLDKPIHQLFDEQVEKTPDSISTVGSTQYAVGKKKTKDNKEIKGKKETKEQLVQITYRELCEKSNRLAHQLQRKGVKPNTIVAIKAERSVEMLIGLLGILKTGGAYLPISP
ncbi:MAG: AMP-binding protein, partial [bacterium]|nr:AMP-binding protein [bacterium]